MLVLLLLITIGLIAIGLITGSVKVAITAEIVLVALYALREILGRGGDGR